MTPSPIPSEGEAMLAPLRDNIRRIDQCLADLNWRPSRAHLEGARNTMQDALTRAAAQSSGVRAQTIEECAKIADLFEAKAHYATEAQAAILIAQYIRARSPDNPREGEK